MEFIKELLETTLKDSGVNAEELYNKINSELPKHTMPKSKFNEVNEELKATKTQLTDTSKMMEELKTKSLSADEYQKELESWKQKYTQFEQEANSRVETLTKKTAVKEILNGKVTKSAVDLLLDKVDISTIEMENNTIKNSDALLETLKTQFEDLFVTTTSNSTVKDQNTNTTIQTDNGYDETRRLMGLPVSK